ncbi:hypothetical protein GUJ93_ZPchr0010g10279 [Zizania palustris]|uniref:Uncharacterized protein n=1 Tax=Zizania palustris TaxID=103762 RepID=A0A8J6BP94_ZIZPA|nr:hypothetical protein GUJ93_ZPchr0010g10279 [Zizania palustris]
MHKLAQIPDDCEDEEGADSVVMFPADTLKLAQYQRNFVLKRESKMKKDAPTDAKTDLGTSVTKSTAAIGHKSHASNKGKVDVSCSDTGKDTTNVPSSCTFATSFEIEHTTSGTEPANEHVIVQARNTSCDNEVNLSSSSAIAKVKEGRHRSASTNDHKHTGRVHGPANKMPNVFVDKSIPKQSNLYIRKQHSNFKEKDNHGTENKSSDSLACSRQTTKKKENLEKNGSVHDDTMTAAIHPSNTITDSHQDKVNKIGASATAIKNAVPIPEHIRGKEVMKESANVIYSTLIRGDSQTIRYSNCSRSTFQFTPQ